MPYSVLTDIKARIPEEPAALDEDDEGGKVVNYNATKKQKYLDCMPDDCTTDGQGVTTCKRPVKPRQVHKFMGWQDRVME